MADNVAITAGTGTDIATDQVGGNAEHVQLFKLAYSADGSRTLVPVDADGVLVNLGTNNDVTVASITAGDNNIGNVDIVTVPAPLSVVGNGAAATAMRVTLANDTTGKVIVSDGTNNVDIDVAPTDGETNGGKRLLHTEAWLWGFNGVTWDRLRSDTTNGLDVDVTRVSGTVTVAAHAVTNAGTFATQVDGAALTSLQLIDDTVYVDDAAFTPATSKVLAVGFEVDDTGTDSVDEGDVGAARMTADRRQIVQLGEAGAKDVVGGGSKTDTSDQAVMAALASNFNYLCWLTVYNASATNTFATLKDGATTRSVIPLPAYGGAILSWPRGLRSTVNTAWNVAAGASVTTAYFYGGGFTATS